MGLAAGLKYRGQFEGRKTGLILSGGNIDLFVLSSVIQRGLVRSGRLARLRVAIPDVPGALAKVTTLLGDTNVNVIEIQHQRAFSHLPLRSAEVEFVIQTLGKDHISKILHVLSEADYDASVPALDNIAGSIA